MGSKNCFRSLGDGALNKDFSGEQHGFRQLLGEIVEDTPNSAHVLALNNEVYLAVQAEFRSLALLATPA